MAAWHLPLCFHQWHHRLPACLPACLQPTAVPLPPRAASASGGAERTFAGRTHPTIPCARVRGCAATSLPGWRSIWCSCPAVPACAGASAPLPPQLHEAPCSAPLRVGLPSNYQSNRGCYMREGVEPDKQARPRRRWMQRHDAALPNVACQRAAWHPACCPRRHRYHVFHCSTLWSRKRTSRGPSITSTTLQERQRPTAGAGPTIALRVAVTSRRTRACVQLHACRSTSPARLPA